MPKPSNTTEQEDRSLHFVVRHDSYQQTLGYRHFLGSILQHLNQNEYGNVAELLIDISDSMRLQHRDPIYNGRDYAKLFEYHKGNIYEPYLENQLEAFNRILAIAHRAIDEKGKSPEEFWTRRSEDADTNAILSKLYEKENDLEKTAVAVFGPAGHKNYGYYMADNILFTPIKNADEDLSIRAYWHTAKKNLGLGDTIPKGYIKRFEYEIPGSGGKKLQLMRIASLETLGSEKVGDCSFKDTRMFHFLQKTRDPDDFWYLHPSVSHQFYYDLVDAMQPLYKHLTTPPQPPAAGQKLPDDKLDDLATLYWLLAQSTPVARGGSGMANLALEHLSFVLHRQGYDFELPFTRDNLDLWAEATTLPLEDEAGQKGFRTRFRESLRDREHSEFFDFNKTPQQVEQYLMDKLMEARAVPSSKITPPAQEPGTPAPDISF